MTRERVGIREIRQNLSQYLRRVGTGEAFEITEHGRSVAVLLPLPDRTTALERLGAAGRARLGTGRNLADLGSPLPPTSDGPPLSDLLDTMREDRT
jgi:prevent-host-death family protein